MNCVPVVRYPQIFVVSWAVRPTSPRRPGRRAGTCRIDQLRGSIGAIRDPVNGVIMTWETSSGVRSNIGNIAVLPAPPPAGPPTDAPQPPPPLAQPSNGEYYNPNDPNGWWPYAGTGSF
jgi:hypothetical protein